MPENPETVEMGEVRAQDLVVVLRVHLGLPPHDPSPRRDLPDGVPADLVARVDLRSLIAWAVLGLWLLAGWLTMGALLHEVRRFVAIVILRRLGGNRSRAQQVLGAHRTRSTQLIGLDKSAKIGTRVVAIESVSTDAVYVYGTGRYAGRERPPNGTPTKLGLVSELWPAQFKVPRLDLDSGGTVWGPQCTWLTEDEFAEEHGAKTVHLVPMP